MQCVLTSANDQLQRALNLILSRFSWMTCLIYVHDGIIHYDSIEDHIYHVEISYPL